MKYGLSEKQLQEITAILASYEALDCAILFGSRAIDTYKEASDVDIAIKGEKADWSLAAKIKDHFEEDTWLPFFFDVVAYDSIESEELKRHIDGKGKVLMDRGMREWVEFRFDEIAIIVDCEHKTAPTVEKGNFYSVRTTNISQGKIDFDNCNRVNEDVYLQWIKRATPETDDIILSREAPVGEVGMIKYGYKVCLGQRTVLVKLTSSEINNHYLLYYLVNPVNKNELVEMSGGSVVAHLNIKDIRAYELKVHPLPEQKAIAEILSSLDDKIDLLRRQNKTLEQMAENLFRQWFVEETGEDWEEGVLGDFAVNPTNSISPINIKADVNYIGLEHINRRNITLSQFGSGQDVTSNKYAFQVNDILFGKLRPYFHKVCFAPFDGICSTDILVIRPKEKHYFSYCLFSFFQDDVVEYANIGSGGTRMPRTNWEDISQYPMCIPDDSKIREFNDLVFPSIEKIKFNQTQIRTLESLRDTLLPKLMSGEIRVAMQSINDTQSNVNVETQNLASLQDFASLRNRNNQPTHE